MREAPKRCAECDCEHGGTYCNWIKTPITQAEHARLMAEKDAEIARLREALQWCSGSPDFHDGGQAREGWLKLCAPLLEGESHD